jgi:hypothetical protein
MLAILYCIKQENCKVTRLSTGLPGMLFSLLDYEVDPAMVSNIHDTINSIMHSMVTENLSSWLALCREVTVKLVF